MAGRKDKNIVDYFPHYCISGKTLFIIESKFNHIGYSVWFKTLELLGSNENHYIDLRNESDMLFLISKLKITEQQFTDIYNLLSKLDAIDSYLWSKNIIFSANFIKNIEDAYKRRSNKCMHKSDLCVHLNIKCTQEGDKYQQKSIEYSRVKKSKEEESKDVFIEFWDSYHSITKQSKTDRDPALKHWNKLSIEEMQKAIDSIQVYYDNIKDYGKGKMPKKARTYLSDKNYNDEYNKNLSIPSNGTLNTSVTLKKPSKVNENLYD